MGLNYDLQVVSHLAKYGFRDAVEHMLGKADFTSDIGKDLFSFMYSWYHDEARRGTTPSIEEIRDNFEGVPIPDEPTHDLKTLLDIQREKYIQSQMGMSVPMIQELINSDPIQALERMSALVNNLNTKRTLDETDFANKGMEVIKKMYESIKSKSGLLGLPFPWGDVINSKTQGLRAGDSWFLLGESGAGKTTLALEIAVFCFMQLNQRVAVICGAEMDKEEIIEMAACMATRTAITKFREGTLSKDEEHILFSQLAALHEEINHPDEQSKFRIFQVFDKGLDPVAAIIEGYKPDILYYDAFYSAADNNPKQQYTLVADFCKMAKRTRTRVLATWQINARAAAEIKANKRRKGNQTDFAGTSAVFHKPVFTTRLIREYGDDVMLLEWPKSRRQAIEPLLINFTPGLGMDLIASGDEADKILAKRAKSKGRDVSPDEPDREEKRGEFEW